MDNLENRVFSKEDEKILDPKGEVKVADNYHVTAECPQCGEKIEIRNEKEGRKKCLSYCVECKKDIVIEITLQKVTYNYDVSVKKVG